MIEKTFLENDFDKELHSTSNKREDNAKVRSAALEEKRKRIFNYIRLSLNANESDIQMLEALDIWDSSRGRYTGEVEVGQKRYAFVAQSYLEGPKTLTHFSLLEK